VADSDGLVNMRARLAALGGSCVVTSEPGRGTTVVLRLPLAGIFHKRTSERTVQ